LVVSSTYSEFNCGALFSINFFWNLDLHSFSILPTLPSARRALGTIILLLATVTAALPQTNPSPTVAPIPPETEITVATRVIAPFVIKDGPEFSGFSIELWHAIGAELGIRSRFVAYDMLPGLLDAVRSGKNEAGIAAISITAERGETLDFSQPMFRSGLSIMVPANSQTLDVMGIMFSTGMLKALGIFLLVPGTRPR
jgi:polar amino acid transport system substrate-binding protein